jgi:hypothetical protein
MWLHRQGNLRMIAAGTVAVEDAGAVEKAVRIRAIGRGIDLPRITNPPTSGMLLTKNRKLTS